MKATKKEHAAFDMCRDFMKGRCRFGRDCYYSHDVKGFRAEQKENGPCWYHFNNKKCFNGDLCRYTHDLEWLNEQKLKNKRKDCGKLIKTGRCENGAACLFNHVGVQKFAFAYAKLN